MEDLSAIDKKVLHFVSLNGINVSERETARTLRLSQATLSYSLRKLEEKKIIKGYLYRLNYDAIGLGCCAWVFYVLKRQCFDLEAVLKKLSEFPEVQLIAMLAGEYDCCIRVFGKNMHDVTDTISRIEKALHPAIDTAAMVFVTKTFKSHQIIMQETNPVELDGLSKKILSFEMQNPKASIKEVCSACKIHRNTASKKWNALYENGVILKKGIVLDLETIEELGFGFKSMIFFNIASDKKDLFAQIMASYPEVHELFRISGHHDFMAIVRTKDAEELFEFHKKLLCDQKFSTAIQRTISRVILKTKNLNYDPTLLLEKQ